MDSIEDMKREYGLIVSSNRAEVPALRCQTGTHRNTIPLEREEKAKVTITTEGLRAACRNAHSFTLKGSMEAEERATSAREIAEIRARRRAWGEAMRNPMNGCSCQVIGITEEQATDNEYIGVKPHSFK